MSNKDFLEKYIKFSDNNKFYIYYSCIPGDEELKGVPEKTDRGKTLIGVETFERRPEDGKIIYTNLVQCDLKMQITPKIIQLFLPSGV
jgi:hypothetical protein